MQSHRKKLIRAAQCQKATIKTVASEISKWSEKEAKNRSLPLMNSPTNEDNNKKKEWSYTLCIKRVLPHLNDGF